MNRMIRLVVVSICMAILAIVLMISVTHISLVCAATESPSVEANAKDSSLQQKERVLAILTIGKSTTTVERSRTILEEILEKDENKFCREASAMALGILCDKKAIPKLKQSLKDDFGNVKMRAVWALAKMGDKSGKELALETIKGEDVTAQLLAVEAIEAIGDKDMIDELKKNLDSKNVWTKIHSKLAIKRLEIQGLSEAEKLNFLEKTLKDNQLEVNRWAAIELGKRGTTEAINILKQATKDRENPGNYSARKILQRLVEMGKISKEDLQR